jgi:SPP1 family predicted phage head-tail adaptor
MTVIAPRVGAGLRPHRVSFQNPGPAVPDGDGGYTQSWIDLSPAALSVRIAAPTARDLESLGPGTVVSTATHVITGPFHSGVTTKTRITFNGRLFQVIGVTNVEERGQEMVILANELVA